MPTRGYIVAALIFAALCSGSAIAQTGSPAELQTAYDLLRARQFAGAIAMFRKALVASPGLPAMRAAGVHKDLAYVLLKTGENAAARDEFEVAMRMNEKDDSAALEYGFLAFETGKPKEARRVFLRLRGSTDRSTRTTAETAFHNIDAPLSVGIERWTEALRRAPNPNDISMYSAHWELAQIAERRDECTLAAREYEACYRMKPQLSELLLALARVYKEVGQGREANAALLAASRRSETRTAEQARELFGTRYPYPYEFVDALKLDGSNVALRKELGFLYLAMHKDDEAIEQFEQVLSSGREDHEVRKQLNALQTAKTGFKPRPEANAAPDPVKPSVKAMGVKSLALGYMRDAIRYLRQAEEDNPNDAEIQLKLGYAYNLAHDDASALKWFDLARRSGDVAIAEEAKRAYKNLNGDNYPKTTIWTLPMYSSRWHDVFSYGQIKHDLPLPWTVPHHWFSLYLSTRFMGDLRSGKREGTVVSPFFSEDSFIVSTGIATKTWHHLTAWGEAGEAISFLPHRRDVGAAIPDYRGGINYAKGFGALLGGNATGLFYQANVDFDYVHRFNKDWILSGQNRAGWTFRLGAAMAQASLNANFTQDLKNQYWAKTAEFGPGFRLRMPFLPPNVYFSTDLLRGAYLNNQGNPRRPNYNDVRVGLWFARSH